MGTHFVHPRNRKVFPVPQKGLGVAFLPNETLFSLQCGDRIPWAHTIQLVDRGDAPGLPSQRDGDHGDSDSLRGAAVCETRHGEQQRVTFQGRRSADPHDGDELGLHVDAGGHDLRLCFCEFRGGGSGDRTHVVGKPLIKKNVHTINPWVVVSCRSRHRPGKYPPALPGWGGLWQEPSLRRRVTNRKEVLCTRLQPSKWST